MLAARFARLRCSAAVQRAFSSQRVLLNYQEAPPPGFRTGRYIDQPDGGDVVDKHIPTETVMHDGRALEKPATLESMGFALGHMPTAVQNFRDDAEVERTYYDEMRTLIKRASGADRVLIFDHTVRKSGNTNLNATKGGSAAPVPRVHCDYTADGAPRRLMQMGEQGVWSHMRNRVLTTADFEDLASRRFAFINVWRNIVDTPVQRSPLAVCDTNSVPRDDFFLYELIFPHRVGENYSLKFNEAHKWYYYPKMTKDECLIFKVYDKAEDGPRFVFHTAFDDPQTTESSPARQSIEIRSIAFFDAPDLTSTRDPVEKRDPWLSEISLAEENLMYK
jgi:hypothetical protein